MRNAGIAVTQRATVSRMPRVRKSPDLTGFPNGFGLGSIELRALERKKPQSHRAAEKKFLLCVSVALWPCF